METLLKKKSYFDKKIFYISLLISIFLNLLILVFFSVITKIVNPPKLPNEPKIKFIEIKKEKEIPFKIKKKFAQLKKEKKLVSKENLGEKKDKTLPIRKVKPVQAEKGKEVKRKIVVNKPKNVVPPKEKRIVSAKKVEKQINKTTSVANTKKAENLAKKTPNIIKTEKKVEKKLPPPPKAPSLENNYSLSPPKAPDVIGNNKGLSELENIEGIKEESPSKLLAGIKTISPTNSKNIEFGKEFKEYDKEVQGSAKTRKIIYMPPPPNIKVKIPIPPKSVKVKIWIAPDGSVNNVILLKKTGDPNLDKAIIEYVKAWRFNKVNINENQWAITTIRFKVR